MQVSSLECVFENSFSYFSTKTYVVGTKNNNIWIGLMDMKILRSKSLPLLITCLILTYGLTHVINRGSYMSDHFICLFGELNKFHILTDHKCKILLTI